MALCAVPVTWRGFPGRGVQTGQQLHLICSGRRFHRSCDQCEEGGESDGPCAALPDIWVAPCQTGVVGRTRACGPSHGDPRLHSSSWLRELGQGTCLTWSSGDHDRPGRFCEETTAAEKLCVLAGRRHQRGAPRRETLPPDQEAEVRCGRSLPRPRGPASQVCSGLGGLAAACGGQCDDFHSLTVMLTCLQPFLPFPLCCTLCPSTASSLRQPRRSQVSSGVRRSPTRWKGVSF